MHEILDAMPDATAVLDKDGTIVAVNRAWTMFSVDNGGDPAQTGTGVNYLDVCRRAADAGCADAGAVATGLRAVLDGGTVESDFEYPCPSPTVGRWFELRATPIARPSQGLMVGHMNITRRKIAEKDLQRQASEDPLTALANRSLFTDRLASALHPRRGRTSTPDVGLVFIDLDRFKPVNDNFGHAAGDEVLAAIAGRLRLQVRAQDTVARLGGDEFAIVAPRITREGLAGLVDRIMLAVIKPHTIHGQQVDVGASVGSYLATAGEDVLESLRRADESMFEIKRSRQTSGAR
ncbi:MAG: diguanylate cyclase [Actinomycetota bacterium]|nr:diguanylate cyclase [Actinomycetota bacterium]